MKGKHKMEVFTKQCGSFEMEDYQAEIKDVITRAKEDYSVAIERVSQLDMMQQDLLHIAETEALDGRKRARLMKKLVEIRKERRSNKVVISYLSRFIKVLDDGQNKFNLGKITNPILLNYEDCDYKPRLITSEELFKPIVKGEEECQKKN